MYQTLITSLENSIFIISINRPDKLNALNNMVMEELGLALDEIYTNDAIRSAVITGSGSKAFVAGADISEFMQLKGDGKALAKKGQELFFRIENAPKPIIAAVNGFALGGGCELAMACHFRIAAENAKFGQPEVNLGIIPGYGGTQRLTRLIGKGRAMELLLSAALIDATTALQFGLVNHVVRQEDLMNKAISILSVINEKPPVAISKCIQAANAALDHFSDGYEIEAFGFGDCFETEDMKEGTTAFLEKRKPVFKGR